MIKVLIVDDSAVAREHLRHILVSDPDICVVGTARNGEEAMELVHSKNPDIVTMDIHMPGMDGFEATRSIMENHPVPIVIVSATWDPGEVESTFRAMEAGAVAALERPRGLGHPDYEKSAKELIQSLKLMSEVKVVRRWARSRRTESRPSALSDVPIKPLRTAAIQLVAMGASTGGPPVLQTILSKLPRDFSIPILIIQHIALGFLHGLVEWLSQSTGFKVKIASHGERILSGFAYFPPDDTQMAIEKGGRIVLSKGEPENGLRPSISCLFRSVASVLGDRAAGVLLTGMGRDGAEELKMMRDKGAVTIVQDKETSVVHGMPGEAIKLGAAAHVLTPDRIAAMLKSLEGKNQKG